MKISLTFPHLAILGIILLMAACTKESFQNRRSAEVQPRSSVVTVSLTASSWVQKGNSSYANTFTDILKPFNSGSSSIGEIMVYIEKHSVDIMRYSLTYQRGELNAEANLNDLVITYYSSTDRIPFRSLDITLVITIK